MCYTKSTPCHCPQVVTSLLKQRLRGDGDREDSEAWISASLWRLRGSFRPAEGSVLHVGGGGAGQSDGIAGMSSTLFVIPGACCNSAGLCNGFQEISALSALGAVVLWGLVSAQVGCCGENGLKSSPPRVGFCMEIPNV